MTSKQIFGFDWMSLVSFSEVSPDTVPAHKADFRNSKAIMAIAHKNEHGLSIVGRANYLH